MLSRFMILYKLTINRSFIRCHGLLVYVFSLLSDKRNASMRFVGY